MERAGPAKEPVTTLWSPDSCPSGKCVIAVAPDFSSGTPVRLCPHHKSLQDAGRTGAEVYRVMIQSVRVREAARAAAKIELALDKEHPGVPYRVEDDGNFTIGVSSRLNKDTGTREWVTMSEWPADKTRLDAAMEAATAKVEKLPGISIVRSA